MTASERNEVNLKKKSLQGLIKRHPDGFGFFIPDDKAEPDVYVPHTSMNGVMTGDHVVVDVFPERGGDRFRGEVTEVLERGLKQVVGIYNRLNEKYGLIRDEAKAWGADLKIPIEKSQNAKDGQMVGAKILTYPEKGQAFTAEVIEVLGDIQDPMSDIKRVIYQNQIPNEWPKAVVEEARPLKHDPEEADFKGRRDLRGLNLITIDGATAKDFDDAVYVEPNPKGFRLIVAIADVSHYVRPGTAIDDEAYIRGTSCYFPNFVVPMLPEVLSNGLCSLNPHVPRLCLVADMQFDFSGEMSSSEFYEGVMDSKARVTYGQAQDLIDGAEIPELSHVRENIFKCADLAKILMAKRTRDGSLDLELPETVLQIDSAGQPVDVIRVERLFSHRLIEEMMLAANVAVAKFLGGREIPSLYRIHEPPPGDALETLERFLANFGARTKIEGGQGKLQKRLTKALQEFHGKPEAQVLSTLTLRSMSQAKYSSQNLGHFGLGFDFYTHFTSPIRRYPDLIVHRLIKNQVLHNSIYRLVPEDDLATAATHLSACEQRSTKAERQIQAIKKARFMERLVGETLPGVISSVNKFGVFVLLTTYDIDGLIRAEDLSSEKLEFDEDNLRLVSKRSGHAYSMGDSIEITVSSVDIQLGQVNFVLKGAAPKKVAAKKEGRRSPFERKGSGQNRQQKNKRPEKRNEESRRGADRGGTKKRTENEPRSGGRKPKNAPPARAKNESSFRRSENSPRRNENSTRPPKEEAPNTDKKLSFFDRLMSKAVDSSPRSVLKGIRASYRSRETIRGSEPESDRKDTEKRRPSEDDRRGVRKARVSQRRRKG